MDVLEDAGLEGQVGVSPTQIIFLFFITAIFHGMNYNDRGFIDCVQMHKQKADKKEMSFFYGLLKWG